MSEERLDEQLIQHISCVVLDIETTGLGRDARIVELAAVRLEAWEPVEELLTLVNPGIPISYSATRVHKITEDMVADAPPFREIAPRLVHIIQDAVLVGHNIFTFDLPFISRQLREVFGSGPNNWAVDTLPLARRLLPKGSHKLTDLAELYGVPIEAHQAMSDVYANAEIWMHLARKMIRMGGKQLLDASRFKSLKQLDGAGLPRFPAPPDVALYPRASANAW